MSRGVNMLVEIISLILLLIFEVHTKKLPDYFHRCSQSSSEINKCIVDAGNDAIPHLVKGIDYLNIPTLSPLHLDKVNLETSEDLDIHMKDIFVYGLESVKLKDVRMDFSKKHVWATLYVPKMKFLGTYDINGKILILTINGEGPANVTFNDVNVDFNMYYDLIPKDKEDYMNITDLKLTYETSRSYFKFDNLFSGDKKLGDEMNLFLNQNWKMLQHELSPYIAATVRNITLDLLSKVTQNVPFSNIFLP